MVDAYDSFWGLDGHRKDVLTTVGQTGRPEEQWSRCHPDKDRPTLQRWEETEGGSVSSTGATHGRGLPEVEKEIDLRVPKKGLGSVSCFPERVRNKVSYIENDEMKVRHGVCVGRLR